jgi:hypothetical protein
MNIRCMKHAPQLGDLLRMAAFLTLALVTTALEFALYKALDDKGLTLDMPAASSR